MGVRFNPTRMKIVEQIVRDEESISMAKSSEFGTVSKLFFLFIKIAHNLTYIKIPI